MITIKLLPAIACMAPMACAFACLLLIAADIRRSTTRYGRELRLLLIIIYLTSIMGWLGLVFHFIHHAAFAWYYPFFLCTLMINRVTLYHFVYDLTSTDSKKQLSPLHYFVPGVITVVALVISFQTPLEQKLAAIYGTKGANIQGWFFYLYYIANIVFIVYNTVYPLLGLSRRRRFLRIADDYFSNPERSSLNWICVIMVLILVTVLMSLIELFVKNNLLSEVYLIFIRALPSFVVCVMLCYNLISENYISIEPEEETDTIPHNGEKQISRARFEKYMHRCKPYTNPNLRITNIAIDLNTNRTYISVFINHEYGMNFNRLVNSYRLRELERLRASAASAGHSNIELILQSGFNSYRSYLRAKSDDDASRTIEQF